MEKFSVLMSVYSGENAAFLHRALESITYQQSVQPDEIILVEDGPLTAPLYVTINDWANVLGSRLICVPLPENRGLGFALRIGMRHCNNEIIARMDSDDISLPERFEKQLEVFAQTDVDVCSSWVSEFVDNERHIVSYRRVPEYHDDIVHLLKLRNALNHPATMYKKSSVQKAGDYQSMNFFEDYYLWIRMAMSGSKFYNIQQPLVNMRFGPDQLKRRSGFKYAKVEYVFIRKLHQIGYLDDLEFIRNLFLRITPRIVPHRAFMRFYKLLRKLN